MFFIFSSDGATSLRLLEVRVPKHAVRGASASLACSYDLDGDVLYSVKWYKDGNEFFRFVPRDVPPSQVFPLPGINVEVNRSTSDMIILENLSPLASGRYRCEVSGEAPSFLTVSEHGDMTIVTLPEDGPRISGGKPRYHPGEWARLNCTSFRSIPAARLAWFVNGEPADRDFLRGPWLSASPSRSADDLPLITITVGIEFRIKPKHFKRGDMKLKCLATLGSVYWRSNEESVEGERPQKPPTLESRNAAVIEPEADSVKEFKGNLNSCSSRRRTMHLDLTVVLSLFSLFSMSKIR